MPKLLVSRPIYIKFIRKFHRLFVQTNNLKQDLEELGMKVFLLPADLINKVGKDISQYPQGDLTDLLKFIEGLHE